MKATFEINGRPIGPGCGVYVVAEISANHAQDYTRAEKLVRAAAETGADAVKLQTYTPDTLTIESDKECFRVREGTLWAGQTLHELYASAYMPWDWQPRLLKVARQMGVELFSSPFDPTAVEFLDEMGVAAFKIASFELVDLPLIELVASKGKPILMSTGMATLEEITDAVAAVARGGGSELALLKCTSAYPAPPQSVNLRTIVDLASRFGVPAGLSDHSLSPAVPVAAVALGTCVIEKHFTLSRADGGPDVAFSLEPAEFRTMVEQIRMAEAALGEVRYEPTDAEAAARAFRRSLFVVADVKKGEPFTAANVRSIRPADGLAPKHYGEVLGRKAACDIERGTPLSWDLLA